MKIELRADGVHISGYVNATGKKSRPVMTQYGRVIEVIEEGAFDDALKRASDVSMLLDHNKNRVLASLSGGSLKLKEDRIGLYAESVVSDADVIEAAREHRIKGWSFDMRNIVDDVETRENEMPIRHVKAFDMSEVTLAINLVPVYSATSVEVRADDGEELVESRATDTGVDFSECMNKPEDPEQAYDNTEFKNRLDAVKTKKI